MTKIIAHRGFSAAYPENTMLAFEKAIAAGSDGIELDVHLTADRQIVVIHDETTQRTTGVSGIVGEMTIAQLRTLDAGSGEKIPTLEEYLNLALPAGVLSNIELKNSIIPYDGLERLLIGLLRERRAENVVLSSFNHHSVLECKRLAPEIRCGFLCESWLIDPGAYTSGHAIECYHPMYCSLTDAAIAELHAHGIEVNAYTVNDPKAIRRLALEHKIAGLITDDPAAARLALV